MNCVSCCRHVARVSQKCFSKDVFKPFVCGCDAAIDGCAVCCLDGSWPCDLHGNKETASVSWLKDCQGLKPAQGLSGFKTSSLTSSMIFRRLLMGSTDEAGCGQRGSKYKVTDTPNIIFSGQVQHSVQPVSHWRATNWVFNMASTNARLGSQFPESRSLICLLLFNPYTKFNHASQTLHQLSQVRKGKKCSVDNYETTLWLIRCKNNCFPSNI